MTTFTATRSLEGFPIGGQGPAQTLKIATGTIEIAINPVAADIYLFCKLPTGSVIVGGHLMGDDLDTNATETLNMDVGWAANGNEAADPDGLGNFGVLTGDVVAEIKPEVSIYIPLGGVLRTTGPQLFTAETQLQAVANVTAATGGTGTLTLVVYYFIDENYVVT